MTRHFLALFIVALSVGIGLGLAWLADSGQRQLLGLPMLPALALLAFVIQWLVWLPSWLARTELYYDLTGSLTYLLLIALAAWSAAQAGSGARAWLLAGLIAVWAVRLGLFLFRRVKRRGKDGRFDEIKTHWSRFLVAWSLQGLWVFTTLLAALIAMTASDRPLGPWAVIGSLIWLAGFAIEVIADRQKSRFNARADQAGRYIDQGLWAWSRHPNYFGEILLWVGIAVIAAPVFSGWQWLGLLSPLILYLLITRVSGVPLLEQRADERWGADPAYRQYRDTTPVLFPRPPRRPSPRA